MVQSLANVVDQLPAVCWHLVVYSLACSILSAYQCICPGYAVLRFGLYLDRVML